MHIRSLTISIGLAALATAPAAAQVSRVTLVRQSDIIFAGTVTRVGGVAAPDLPASPRTVVVRVNQVFEKPDAVSLMNGDSVTVQVVRAGSLSAGLQATFYTTGWIFGRGVAVREVGHEPIRAQLAGAVAAAPVQQDSVAKARRQVNDADLRARIQAAAMVVVGRVEQVRPAAYTGAAAPPRRFTEHDPDWQEAIIHVDEAIKGAQTGERVVVRFPGSHDVAFVGTPRFTAGQEGTFLLQRDAATGSPLTMMGAQSVPAYTALHRLDVLTKQEAQRVRAVMRQP